MTDLLDVFVPGMPASFATSGERAWKDAITVQLRGTSPDARGRYLSLDFSVAPTIGYPAGPDLDNLCEPDFSVVVNRLGWFSGSRPKVQGFRARKRVATPTGCRVRITEEPFASMSMVGDTLLDGAMAGPLPTSARDAAFIRWVLATMVRPASAGTSVGVDVRFAGPINLGDIATGRLKNIIDCLQPVLGGRVGAPDDSRVTVLEATRMAGDVDGAVRVRVVEFAG